MNTIPAEIALAIARTTNQKDLHALTLVNRQFHTVATPLLWRLVDIETERKYSQVIRGMRLSNGSLFQHIRSLYIELPMESNTVSAFISLLSPSLEELNLPNAFHVTDETLKQLPIQCPQLTSLSLGDASITDQFLVLLGEHCSQLRTIYFDSCVNLSPNLFACLAACPLEKITVIGRPMGGVAVEDTDTARKLALDLVGFRLLTMLILVDVGIEISHQLLATLDQDGNSPWPQLTGFCIMGCEGVED
ncbi:unnamed protein product [Absidia cylindrospora]